MKYNDNGTYKDIYLKTFDTLPVGSEVDYDGQTVPSGWEEVTDMSGSNANGSWIKFDDGTMICYINYEYTVASFGTDGSFYYANVDDVLFPQTFYSKPVVNVTVNNKTDGRRIACYSCSGISASKIWRITLTNYWAATNSNIDIQIMAIGRWKA